MVVATNAIEVNGTTLYYDEAGKGQPMLFIHGMCGDADTWADQLRRLSTRFRCIAYDRRGHTRSPLGQFKQRRVELHADDAAGLIAALDLAPCIIVGSSSGARITLDVVRRYPSLVKGAVLSEPPLLSLDPAASKAFIGEIKSAVEAGMAQGGPAAAVDAFFALVCPGFWPSLPEQRRNAYRANATEMFGDLTMPPYEVSQADLARIHVPCLAVSGSESDSLMRTISAVLAQAIPGAREVQLAGSGHVTYAEKPDEFAAAVLDFVSQL
ncbi:MAG: alpha/beta hydrolase [Nitrolancea sp.]